MGDWRKLGDQNFRGKKTKIFWAGKHIEDVFENVKEKYFKKLQLKEVKDEI